MWQKVSIAFLLTIVRDDLRELLTCAERPKKRFGSEVKFGVIKNRTEPSPKQMLHLRKTDLQSNLPFIINRGAVTEACKIRMPALPALTESPS